MGNEYILTKDGELYHWGIKGMRWGVRRYQTKNGALTPAGKKRYDKDMAKVKAETKRIKNQQATDKKLSKLEEAKNKLASLKGKKVSNKDNSDDNAETAEQTRDRILKTPTAKDIIENRHLFNDREIQSLRLRLQEEQYIKSMIPAEVSKGKEFTNRTVEKFNDITTLVDSGSKTWNGIAKVYNAFFAGKTGVELPLISDKVKSKADKIKEEAELLEAKNRKKKALKDDPDREKSEYEKLKEETERLEVENRKKKALKDDPDREKTDDEKYAEETRKINAEVARKSAENKLREVEAKKAELDAADEKARLSREAKNADSAPYSNVGGDRTYVNPNNAALTVYNPPIRDISSSVKSRGQSYTNTSYDKWDDYVDVTNDPSYPGNRSTSSSTIALGQSIVSGYLSAPKDDD